jgi:hypothetical protein
VVRIRGVRGKPDFFGGLRQKFLRSPGVSAQIVVIVLLGFVHFLSGLLDVLLRGAHVSVPLADVYRRRLRE